MSYIKVSKISTRTCYQSLKVVGKSYSLKSAVITNLTSEEMFMSSLTGWYIENFRRVVVSYEIYETSLCILVAKAFIYIYIFLQPFYALFSSFLCKVCKLHGKEIY